MQLAFFIQGLFIIYAWGRYRRTKGKKFDYPTFERKYKNFTQPNRYVKKISPTLHMYENVDQMLKTKICVVKMAFLFDLAASRIWSITQHTVRDENFFI